MSRRVFGLFIFAAITLFVRLHFITFEYPDLDQAEAMYHAEKMLAGGVLYRDSFTHHHPGAIVGALVARLVFGANSHLATNWIGLVLTLISGGLVFIALSTSGKVLPALLGALICSLAYFPADIPYYPQSISAVFVVLLIWLHQRRCAGGRSYWIIDGLVCGAAFAADQRCLLLLAPMLWTVTQRRISTRHVSTEPVEVPTARGETHPVASTRHVSTEPVEVPSARGDWLWLVFGFFIGVAPFALYLLLTGAFSDYLYQCWIFPATVRSGSFSLARFLSTGLKLHLTLNGGLIVAALVGLVVYLRSTRNLSADAGFFLIFAGALFLISAAGNETFSNYLIIWFPFIGFFCGVLFHAIESRFVIGNVLAIAISTLLILLSVGPIEARSVFSAPYFRYSPSESVREAAEFVKESYSQGSDIYVWGYCPQFYLYAEKLSKFRHVNQIAMTGAYFHPEDTPSFEPTQTPAFAEFEKYMRETPPRFFVIYDNVKSWKTFDQRIVQAKNNPGSHLFLLSAFVFAQLEQRYGQGKRIGDFVIFERL